MTIPPEPVEGETFSDSEDESGAAKATGGGPVKKEKGKEPVQDKDGRKKNEHGEFEIECATCKDVYFSKTGKTKLCLKCRRVKCERCKEKYETESGRTKLCPKCRPKSHLTPVDCLACGCEFQSASGKSKLCMECRDGKSVCETCNEIFKSTNRNYRDCAGCRKNKPRPVVMKCGCCLKRYELIRTEAEKKAHAAKDHPVSSMCDDCLVAPVSFIIGKLEAQAGLTMEERLERYCRCGAPYMNTKSVGGGKGIICRDSNLSAPCMIPFPIAKGKVMVRRCDEVECLKFYVPNSNSWPYQVDGKDVTCCLKCLEKKQAKQQKKQAAKKGKTAKKGYFGAR
jgi:hypothetical protein